MPLESVITCSPLFLAFLTQVCKVASGMPKLLAAPVIEGDSKANFMASLLNSLVYVLFFY